MWIDCCVSRTPAGVRSVQAQVLFDATDGELAALAGAVDVSDGVDKAIGTRFRACVADYVGPDRTAWGGYYQRLQQCRGLTIVGARGRTISCVNRNPDLDLLSAPGAVFGAEYRLYDASREAVEAAAVASNSDTFGYVSRRIVARRSNKYRTVDEVLHPDTGIKRSVSDCGTHIFFSIIIIVVNIVFFFLGRLYSVTKFYDW